METIGKLWEKAERMVAGTSSIEVRVDTQVSTI